MLSERTVLNNVTMFLHCKLCLEEKPPGISPRDYSELEVGFTAPGFQVWCRRHEANVINVDFEGAGPFPGDFGL